MAPWYHLWWMLACLVVESRGFQRHPAFLIPSDIHIPPLRAEAHSNVAKYTVRGGQCFLPAEQHEQRILQDEWRRVSDLFGFAEYSIGVLAHADLFKSRGVQQNSDTGSLANDHPDKGFGLTLDPGQSDHGLPETDIDTMDDLSPNCNQEHRNELYEFTDRKGRRLALRGDVTPQFMAMLKEHWELPIKHNLNTLETRQITKWFTMADCWRYERPGHCRRRNHIQWTCDIVGIPNEDAEIELLTMLITFYKNVGLTTKDIAIHLNHVDALPTLLESMGKPVKDHTWMHQFRKVIDKYRKINRNELCIALNQLGFNNDEVNKLLDSIANCSDINTYAKLFGNETPFVKSLQNIVHGVEHAQHSDWLHMDLSIVRGTDYYTGAVFECFDRMHPQHRAIAGGGRYDNYLGPKESNDRQLSYSVGFGMGNIGIIETMRSRNLLQEQIFTDIVLYNPHSSSRVPLRGVDLVHVNKVLYSLRDSGIKVFHYFQGTKLAKALEFAERASSIALIYPKLDDATGTLVYQVHNIPSKSKTLVDKEDVLQFLERMRRHKTN